LKSERRSTKICACNKNVHKQFMNYWDRNFPCGYLLLDRNAVEGRLVMTSNIYEDNLIAQYDVMQDWLFDMENEFEKMQKRYTKYYDAKRKNR